jgi:hypothetical protein
VHVFLKKKEDFIAMGKGKQFLSEEKSKIMCWGEIGIKSKEIAARQGRRERVVWIHLSVLKKLPPPKARSGRPSKTSKAQDQRLKAYVEKYLFQSARQLKNEVVGGLTFAVRTLQKQLQKKLGLPSCFFDFRASSKNICTLEPHMKLATFVVG